jgi:hypothetical protein
MVNIYCFSRSFLKNERIPVLLGSVLFFLMISKIAFGQTETVYTDPAWDAGQKNTIIICAGGTVTVHIANSTEKHTYQIIKYPGAIPVEDKVSIGGLVSFTPLTLPSTGEFLYRVQDADDAIPNPTFKVVVVADPVAPVLKKSPDIAKVNAGQDVSASLKTPGSGGISCTDQFEYRTETGTTWSKWAVYKPGNTISTAGRTGIEIKAERGCSGNGCAANDNTYSWTIISKP